MVGEIIATAVVGLLAWPIKVLVFRLGARGRRVLQARKARRAQAYADAFAAREAELEERLKRPP